MNVQNMRLIIARDVRHFAEHVLNPARNFNFIEMLQKSYKRLEAVFEKFSEISLRLLGNSITFILAASLVIYWLKDIRFDHANFHDSIRDVMISMTFLAFFLVQKSVNKFSKALHVKLNELVYTQDKASNEIVSAEELTEDELSKISRKYSGRNARTSKKVKAKTR